MQLSHLNIIGQNGLKTISVEKEKISTITDQERSNHQKQLCLSFENALAFPGLINSHDHLDFNLFPQLKNRNYKNYAEWGADIHRSYKNIIDQILTIPKSIRFQWGIYKNILNGVTSVIDHGSNIRDDTLITIDNKAISYHSISGEKFWKLKLNSPFKKKNQMVVIHIGEGIDDFSSQEIDRLIKWNLFKRKIIGVHGVAMNSEQAKTFEALVWCPASNFYLLNETAKMNELKTQTKILFGTDSTLSASWNLWEHLRLARKTNLLSDRELFDSITTTPASIWKLNDKGILSEGKDADIVVARRKDVYEWNSFYQIDPGDILLVTRKGMIVLFDESFHANLKEISKDFSRITVNKACKYVKGNLSHLVEQIKEYAPEVSLPIGIN